MADQAGQSGGEALLVKRRQYLLLICCLLLLTGCWDRIELNDVAIVTAAGIDRGEHNEIELTIQVLIPRALSGDGAMQGGGLQNITLVRTAKGINIADAMSKIQMKIPRMIFWGHCKVYLYGEAIAKSGITELVDYLARHPEPRNRALMYVSKGKAADVLKVTPEIERYSAETVRELSGLHVGMEVTLIDLLKMLKGPSKAAILPIISLYATKGSESKLNPYLMGSAVFKEGKMIGQLTERMTRGVMWVRNEIAASTVSVKVKNVKGFVSLNPIRETTKLTPVIQNGKWKMIVAIETEGDLIQNGTNLNLVSPELLHLMQVALRKDIETRINRTLQHVQHGMKVDIFGFATQFHRKYPKEFASVKDKWEEKFPTLDIELKISSYIKRPGLITIPAGIPESEVRQK
ncbi:Ger(x)C family spore germination protein [Brevibacillus nitrificans]|uniref:Ger(x)C family spore germination protein n=1 Tax=Brevibacillus nitrificans TaxID=651560 RepID=UPI002861D6EA|nr:Ger(x)C family spore germination protein [Brevibacillus nitrificans]MDR7319361.1 spore germination protein KC [Brevibacillus nitrificans]